MVAGKLEFIGDTRVTSLLLRSMNWVPDAVKITLMTLMSYAYGNKDWCNPSIPRLANDRSTTTKTIHQHLKFLETNRLISVARIPGKRNKYRIADLLTFDRDVLKFFEKNYKFKDKDTMSEQEIIKVENQMNDLYKKLKIKKKFVLRRTADARE